MPGITNRAQMSRMTVAGQKEIFTKNFDTYPSTYAPAVTLKTSTKAAETYDSIGNLKAAEEKLEGGPINYGGIEQAYQTKITNKTVANGFFVTYEEMEDDLYAVVNSAKAKELSRTMKDAEEAEAWRPYNEAFTVIGADGVALCSDSHPLKNSASVNDNLTTGAITVENLKAGLMLSNGFLNHAGQPYLTEADQIITHKNNMFTVQEILKSVNSAGEISNTKNVLPPLKEIYTRWLTSTTSWFLRDSTQENIIFQSREKTRFGEDTDKISTLNIYLNAIARYKAGFINAFGIVGSTGL